jgi:hypothetical protein
MTLSNTIPQLERIKRLRALFTRPRTYVAWHGERFAIFLTTDGVNEIKKTFVGIGGVGEVTDRDEQAKLVRCREVPVLGHRPTWTDEMVSTGCVFASWKYSNSGKVWGWNLIDRERSQRWMLYDGAGVKA